MVVRQRRKKNKLRGQRTHGAGNTKNRRGSGCRGGVGRAGSHKHKFSIYWKEFGKHSKLLPKTEKIALNLEEFLAKVPKWVDEKKVEKTANGIEVDGKKICVEKILGRGNVTVKLLLKNIDVSKGAGEKILSAGGKIEKIEKPRKEKKEDKLAKKTAVSKPAEKSKENAKPAAISKPAEKATAKMTADNETEITKPKHKESKTATDSETEFSGKKIAQ